MVTSSSKQLRLPSSPAETHGSEDEWSLRKRNPPPVTPVCCRSSSHPFRRRVSSKRASVEVLLGHQTCPHQFRGPTSVCVSSGHQLGPIHKKHYFFIKTLNWTLFGKYYHLFYFSTINFVQFQILSRHIIYIAVSKI